MFPQALVLFAFSETRCSPLVFFFWFLFGLGFFGCFVGEAQSEHVNATRVELEKASDFYHAVITVGCSFTIFFPPAYRGLVAASGDSNLLGPPLSHDFPCPHFDLGSLRTT